MSETTQFLVRWLCHDLATPIASVMTASELLEDDTPDPEINGLITGGARRLSARLRLVRLALGAADSALSAKALEKLVREGLPDARIDWQFAGDAIDGMAPLVAGCAMLTADLNRLRGLAISNGGVRTDGDCTWPDSVAAVFAGAPPSCNRGAVAAMLLAAAGRAGQRLSCDSSGLHWG
ncbi:MAG: hypothetical protein KGQ52_08995 [Alphaproteobacteria bacterium]|nr:hypothetical protein [Alphaproteobacteria bacterium]